MCVRCFCAILKKESPPRQRWQGLKRIFAAGRRWKRAKVSNHKPRKGTETQRSLEYHQDYPQVSNHKPRKGTETGISITKPSSATQFQITNPARGRKRLEPALLVDGVEVKFQITNPARGRKRFARFTQNIFWQSFQITNPARGRKLNSGTVSRSMMICFKSQTPQGDGNGAFRRGIRDSHSSFKSQTPQGDGNTPASSSSICHHFPTFQITNPARGRRRGCTGSCSPFFL